MRCPHSSAAQQGDLRAGLNNQRSGEPIFFLRMEAAESPAWSVLDLAFTRRAQSLIEPRDHWMYSSGAATQARLGHSLPDHHTMLAHWLNSSPSLTTSLLPNQKKVTHTSIYRLTYKYIYIFYASRMQPIFGSLTIRCRTTTRASRSRP